MVGVGETYLPAFVLQLTGSHLACGLVNTVPLVAGALLQLVTPRLIRQWPSHRGWVVLCAAAQAVAFVPLVLVAWFGWMSLAAVFAVVTLYWAAGLASAPTWNVWMETLVPQRVRARYFARRTCIGQWGVSGGFLAGGIALNCMAGSDHCLTVFAMLFAAAGASRLLSALLLSRQSEPLAARVRPPASPMLDGFLGLTHGPKGRVLVYLLAAQAAVQIAGPYFNPYMLGPLRLSYWAYVVLLFAVFASKIVFLPLLTGTLERWGAERVFWVSAACIVPVPAMWLISDSFLYLVGCQVFSGAAWAMNDLASLLLFFKTIPRDSRVRVLTAFNFANAATTAGGALLGGAMLAVLGTSREAYLTLFVVSSLARAAALGVLLFTPAMAMVKDLLRPSAPVPIPETADPGAPHRHLPVPHWPRKPAAAGKSSEPAVAAA